jgi:hypothetical protein
MEDPVDPVDKLEQGRLGQVSFDELEFRPRASAVEVRILERSRIVVGEGIDTEDLVPSLEEGFDEV